MSEAKRLIEHIVLTALLKGSKRSPLQLVPEERTTMLYPHAGDIEKHAMALEVLIMAEASKANAGVPSDLTAELSRELNVFSGEI